MVTNFDHVHIYSADLDAALAFYTETLGGELVGRLPNSQGDFNHLVLLGGQFVALSHYPPGLEPAQPPEHGDGALTHGFGVAHLGLNVDALAPIIARLEAAGIEVHSAPRGDQPLRYVYFTAPDGVVIELTEYVLPARLRPAAAALKLFNRGVHRARHAIGKALLRAAT